MKRKKRLNIIILAVIIIGLFAAAGIKVLFASLETNLEQMTTLTPSNVDLSKLEDGIYAGGCKAFPVAAEVKVTVNNHSIKAIELVKHDNGQGASAEIIPSKVVEAQSLEVDIVSGATYSSKIILKAIENALTGANKE